MSLFTHPWGELQLERRPLQDDNLLPFNAADSYLLNYFATLRLPPESRVLVFNDDFGALSLALVQGGYHVVHSCDSALSQRAVLINGGANTVAVDERVSFVDSLSRPQEAPQAVLLKVPRNLSLLEHQLRIVRSLLDSPVPVLGGGMSKEIHTSTLDLFAQIVGPVTTSLAERKARLIIATLDTGLRVEPKDLVSRWDLPGIGLQVAAQPNVFSRERLDLGTRFLLQNFPRGGKPKVVIDLGCGSGVLGAVTAKLVPETLVFCVDESFMAVWSARETFRLNQLDSRGIFLAGDCLEDFDRNYADRILCNPPFHDARNHSQTVARRMFEDSHRVLKPGGEFWVVANLHLGYHKVLGELFGQVSTVAKSDKYILFKAVKT